MKSGFSHGATDELGYHSVNDIVPVRNLHATMLHQLGLDHHKLSIKFQGLDTRLTGVKPAKIVRQIIA